MMLFVACSHDDDGGVPSGENLETVKLYISVPGVQSTRMGDPGTAVDEGKDWDELAIIMAYTDDSQVTLPNNSKVQVTTISKNDFVNLPIYGNTNYRLLSIDAQPGKVYIYGVTYSKDADNNPYSDISNCKTNEAVQALTISNDYSKPEGGTIDYAQFVSVATGYYNGGGTTPAEFEIQEGITSGVGNIPPTMTLTRLAAKIDIQWDAADAYEAGYTDVKVTGFTYKGTEYGRLFPNIASSNYSAKEQDWSFYNTSEISQRNGRVYHYTFPDGTYINGTTTAGGVTVPSVTFNISATQNGTTTTNTYTYTLNFQSALQKATWYKVNAWIKGITGSGTINLSMDNTGVQTGE